MNSEALRWLKRFHLVGRKIKQMRLVGTNYNLGKSKIEQAAFECMQSFPEEERRRITRLSEADPRFLLKCRAMIDEPLLIQFEDGDVFAIRAPFPEPVLSMNRVSWNAKAEINEPNTDANVLFSSCIGKVISDAETQIHPIFHSYPDGTQSQKAEEDYILRLEDGTGLRIGSWLDFWCVDHVDSNNEVLLVPFSQLRPGLIGWNGFDEDR